MKRSTMWKRVCLLAGAALCAQGMFAQVRSSPLVAKSKVAGGFMRPHTWVVAAPAAVHGPGQTNCASGCYYYPADIQTAYATNYIAKGNGGAGITIAIVDAYHYADAESDLHQFSAQFGLPDCTSASGCFTQVNQNGGPAGGASDPAWAVEVDVDLQWAHAIAPKAHILLVEGADNSFESLMAAVEYARLNADVVSNSYGTDEFAEQTTYNPSLAGSPVPILFSSGDSGASASWPCTNPNVVCVGGTSLLETSTGYRANEKGWAFSGGSCSTIEGAPLFQNTYSTAACGTWRGVPDVAAIGDTTTGVIVYLGPLPAGAGSPGLYIGGGTSVGPPIVAGLIANIDAARVTAGKPKLTQSLGQHLYQGAANPLYRYRYYDVTVGNNGYPTATGWDRVTGLGVPLGPSLAAYLVSLP